MHTEILPSNPVTGQHAWCRDPSRDERVRAAEDGRTGPLPTLGECIVAPFADAAERPVPVSKTGEGQSGLRTERVTLEVTHDDNDGHIQFRNWDQMLFGEQNGVRFPGESVRVVEDGVHGWKDMAASLSVDVLKLTAERDAAIREREQLRQSYRHCREVNASVCDERDALKARVEALESEVKLFNDGQPTAPSDLGLWDTAKGLSERCKELAARLVTTSVRATAAEARVAELEAASGGGDVHFDDLAQVAMERDAAIRERDEMRKSWLRSEESGTRLLAERNAALDDADGLRKRVAELEAASGGGKPVAYFVKWADKDWAVQDQTFRTRERAQDYINDEKSEDENPQIVPLYRAPPQPRGWLTGEEREAITLAAAQAPESDFVTNEEGRHLRTVLTALLARSTPPEVVKPVHRGAPEIRERDSLWLRALAAAGVEVKE